MIIVAWLSQKIIVGPLRESCKSENKYFKLRGQWFYLLGYGDFSKLKVRTKLDP